MLVEDHAMRGVTRLRDTLALYLSATVPPAIDYLRTQYGLSDKMLPYPAKYNTSDPTEAEVWPYVGSYVTGADQFNRTGNVEPSGAIEYEKTYELTIFVAVKTALLGQDASGIDVYEQPTYDSALRQRDDLMAAIEQAIFSSPSLGTARSKNRFLVNEDSIRLSLPEPVSINTYNAYSCTGLMTVNVRSLETTVVPYLGRLNQAVALEIEKVNLNEAIV
jgi:hypothetical protein